jgi:hypothetical protein
MSLVLVLTLKSLAGGILVAAFAALGERVRPQGLAGLLAAAPAVALASLAVTAAIDGAHQVGVAATGMTVGAAALAIASLLAVDTVRRFGALRGSVVSVAAWLAVAAALYGATLR